MICFLIMTPKLIHRYYYAIAKLEIAITIVQVHLLKVRR